jgi:hypothetical protein
LLFLFLDCCLEIDAMTNVSNAAVVSQVPRVTVTPDELLKRVAQVKASTIVSVVILTDVKMLKKHRDTKEPCPYGEITKRTVMNVMFGTDYSNAVDNRRVKEGGTADFEVAPHQWAEHVDGKPAIVMNKAGDQSYANCRVLNVSSVEYLQDGVPVDADSLDLDGYGPKKGKEGARQQVEDAVIWRTVKLAPECSFETVRANGVELVVA